MKTEKGIHPAWLSTTLTRFYYYTVVGWRVTVYPNGSWEGDLEK